MHSNFPKYSKIVIFISNGKNVNLETHSLEINRLRWQPIADRNEWPNRTQ